MPNKNCALLLSENSVFIKRARESKIVFYHLFRLLIIVGRNVVKRLDDACMHIIFSLLALI